MDISSSTQEQVIETVVVEVAVCMTDIRPSVGPPLEEGSPYHRSQCLLHRPLGRVK
jgi:hypothetical protein